MFIKKRVKILYIVIPLLVSLSLAGCIGTSTDETQIKQIAKNIEKAIDKKNVNLFMENISYNYSDEDGGTYDNHINSLPEDIFSKIEEAEDLVDNLLIVNFKIETEVNIPESDLVLADIYASGKMTIQITLKGCILWCIDLYNENIEYNVNFIKENDDWKIIFLEEI